MNDEKEYNTNMPKKLQKRILNTIDQVDKGFRRVMMMYTIAFYAGLILIFLSLVLTLVFGENIFFLIFGGVGLVDVFTFFAFKPSEALQISRGNLAQLIAAIMTWLNDMHNWGAVIQMEITDRECDEDVIEKISNIMLSHTITIMWAIDIFVEGKIAGDQVKLICIPHILV